MKRRIFFKKMMTGAAGLTGLDKFYKGFDPAQKYKSVKDTDSPRTRESLDFDWKFKLGEVKEAQQSSYNDQNWRTLDLPHDWGIEGEYQESNPSSWHGAYLPGGVGWYRRELSWNSDWEGKNVYIDFDGIYMNSEVWINGHYLGKRPYGYISFRYDLTPYLKKSGNVIAVRVDNSKEPSCRWYSGSGIYRHVWLTVTNPVQISHWGIYITTPQITDKQAKVRIQTQVENNSQKQQKIVVQQRISGFNNKIVAGTEDTISLKPDEKQTLGQTTYISEPELWSPDEPFLYEVETVLFQNDEIIDQYISPLGIRTLEYSAQSGFKINGKPTLIKGVCNHHDAGPVGAAVPDDVLYRRLKLLKDMGCNAIRTAHNPQSPEFYTFCDMLGLMVMNEAFDGWGKPKAKYDYGLYFEEWWQKDLQNFIFRDRNHPSVIMWSIGNEVHGFTDERQKELVDFIKDLDDTRPITQGRSYRGSHIDIAGFNGHGEMKGVLKDYHQKHPEKPLIGTEMTHTNQTRGVYRTQTWYRARDYMAPWENEHSWDRTKDKVFKVPDLTDKEVFTGIPRKYLSSYDNAFVRINVRDQYKHDRDFPFLLGSFRWTGFDYLGEAINRWPTRSSNFGIIDLAGIPKDHFYLYQSLWSDKPMVHLLPHWTHPGKEGVKIPVVAYTNCSSVELFFNDESLGEKPMTDALQIVWRVPYYRGKLRAVAKDENGKILAETTRQTAGQPSKIQLMGNKTSIRANRRDVVRFEVSVVDKKGIVVPQADHRIHFRMEGPGKLIGVENGDIADLDPCKGHSRKAFHGKCMALVQSMDQPGTITLHTESDELENSTAEIQVFSDGSI